MPEALISLGSNQGDRRAILAAAVDALAATAGCRVLGVSSWLATTPIGGPAGQGEFLNGAVRLDTTLAPLELLHRLHEIETSHGRDRAVRWGPRTLDLDLLLWDRTQVHQAELTLPHPGLEYRRFALEPAVAIAAEMIHPRLGWSLRQLLRHLDESPPWLAVAAADQTLSQAFIHRLIAMSPVTLWACSAEEAAAAAQPSAIAPQTRPTFRISELSEECVNRGGGDTLRPLAIPRLTLVLDGPPLAWAPGLTLSTADLDQAVQQAVAAIEASLPQNVQRPSA